MTRMMKDPEKGHDNNRLIVGMCKAALGRRKHLGDDEMHSETDITPEVARDALVALLDAGYRLSKPRRWWIDATIDPRYGWRWFYRGGDEFGRGTLVVPVVPFFVGLIIADPHKRDDWDDYWTNQDNALSGKYDLA